MPGVLRLLHVEDSPIDELLIRAELETAGYALRYRRVETAAEMAVALSGEKWDLVISDFNLPDFDAEGALTTFKESGLDVPFIIVSGLIGEAAAVALMKAGAHDYVMKDNRMRLVPAIERELKEAEVRRQRSYAEAALKAREKLLDDITSSLGEGLLVQDREGYLILMNPEAERLLGWTGSDLAKRHVHEAIHYPGPDGTILLEEECPICTLALAGQRHHAEDDHFARKDGTSFPVSYVTTPVIGEGQVSALVTAFRDISVLKKAELELKESRRQLQELLLVQQTIREEERKRIARELHDELGQTLTAFKIDLTWLGEKLPNAEAPISGKLAAMESLVNRTVDSLRRISEDLRPGMLDVLGLAAAIEHHVAKFTERTGITCDLAMNRDDFDLSDQMATAVFRICQESLTNVARHAVATQVTIRLQELDSELLLVVQDNGCGLPDAAAGKKKSYGLLGMRERVRMLGGQLEISSEPGKGTRIEASIPKQEAQS